MGHLVGGISSAGRVMPALDGVPFLVTRAQGPYVWDRDRRYIDTALGFGATLVGHAHPAVVEAISRAAAHGSMPAFAHPGEEAAAAALAAATGNLSRIIFTNTGSEAVHLACRLARACTHRGRIAKMAAGFDGWYDEVAFGNAGASDAAMLSNTRPTRGHMTLVRFNDFDDVERLFEEFDDIAAILFEPMLANAGCLAPAEGYLRHVEAVARRHGALLIADEVLMGFRTRFGLTCHAHGISPDIATLGKLIGSGVPVAAVAGTAEVMERCERGEVVRAGTYSGNPIATGAVCATMEILGELDYEALLKRGEGLRGDIVKAFADAGIEASTSGCGTVFTLWFTPRCPRDYAEALAVMAPPRTVSFHLEARRRGLVTMPFAFGRMYLSTAHEPDVLTDMVDIVRSVAKTMS
jgi:glutamate-1-semialdehyde 2,1-aminomutase